MVKELVFKFGRAPGVAPEIIKTTPVTVFVGPNNSGKSKVLQELNRYCTQGQRNMADVILERIQFEDVSPEAVDERIKNVTLKPNRGETLHQDHVIVGKLWPAPEP